MEWRTRLHAKAYHLRRASGFTVAYIGSANMSGAAMTSGLEWNLKVTARDMPHILERFVAEFDTYWHSREFQDYDPDAPERFREAIARERKRTGPAAATFFDLTPHPFQECILEALAAERTSVSLNQPVVFFMGADPHPREIFTFLDSERSMANADPG